eukprot:m.156198 g.156198  ORF g.156198 m.156198 type:complete len:107 (-) comp17936_c1_seq62:3757-4077(-)
MEDSDTEDVVTAKLLPEAEGEHDEPIQRNRARFKEFLKEDSFDADIAASAYASHDSSDAEQSEVHAASLSSDVNDIFDNTRAESTVNHLNRTVHESSGCKWWVTFV